MRPRPRALGLIILTLLLAACSRSPAGPPPGEPRDPFTTRIEGAEGISVVLSGYTRGHQPGGDARFELSLHQQGAETWQGRYCVQLLNRQGPVLLVANEEFRLPPGGGWTRSLPARFPADLPEGYYGLALVVPERLAMVTTIEVGEPADTQVEPWPAPACP